MIQDPFISHLISKHSQPAFIDSVGSGCIFGGIIACAVMFIKPYFHPEVDDSKKLKHKDIYRIAPELKTNVIYSFGLATAEEINSFKSTFTADKLAMLRAVKGLPESPDALFLDGDKKYALHICSTEYTIVKADEKVFGVACASVIAKDHRDHLMINHYSKDYPQYSLHKNKGYKSPTHFKAIREWGITPYHRVYMPQLQRIINEKDQTFIHSNVL
jgi:ribonuclease HII